MQDDVLSKAVALRDAIDAEVATVSEQVERLRDRLSDLGEQRRAVEHMITFWSGESGERAGAEAPVPVMRAPEVPTDSPRSKPRPTDNTSKEEVADETRRLVEERGAPIPRPELLKLLIESGFKIEGSNPLTVLSTMLWRAREHANLIHLRSHGYWTAEKPYGPAGYYPNDIFEDRSMVDQEGSTGIDPE